MSAGTFTVHRSRTVPLCIRCRYQMGPRCLHPALPVDVVDGVPKTPTHLARLPSEPCGPDAVLFEPKQHAAAQEQAP